MATLGDRIARGRAKARLSQADLAKAVGVTRSWIGAVETDRIARPRPAYLRLLADQLGLDYNELLAITDQLGEVEVKRVTAEDVDRHRMVALDALTAALEAQAEAMRELAAEMRELRESTLGQSEGLGAAIGALSETLESLKPALAGRSR